MSFDLQELLLDLPVDLLSICYQNIVDANNRLVRRVVCGTAESAVLAFDFSTTNEDDDGPIRFRAAWKSKLKGKIEQVLCSTWKGNPTIWALQNGGIFELDAASLGPRGSVDGLKDIRRVFLEPESPILFAATKTRILAYDIRQKKILNKEVSIPSPVHSWTSVKPSTICLGLGDYFGFLDIEHMSLNLYKTLECLPKSTEALLVTHISSEEIALTRQDVTVFVAYQRCMDALRSIRWTSALVQLVHLAGNLIGLARDRIEVRSAADGQLLQSEAISHGMGLAVTESGLLIHGIRELYDIRVVSTEEQVRDLLERHGYDEAAELIARAEPEGKTREAELSRIRLLQAHYLFSVVHDHEAALTLFEQLDVPTRTVLQLYPQLENNVTGEDLGEMDRHSLFALCRFLMHRRMLWLQRSETLPNKDTEARYVDEALLVAYALTDAQMAGRLVRSQNACRAEFVETFFTPLGRFEDVLDFFHNRGLHREAAVYLERDVRDPAERNRLLLRYLRQLEPGDLGLIVECAPEAIVQSPFSTLQVLLDIKFNKSVSNRHTIAAFLDSVSGATCAAYLLYLVSVFQDAAPAFHNKIALELMSAAIKSPDPARARLKEFLAKSTSYDANLILSFCPKDEPDLAALLLSRLGEYSKALKALLPLSGATDHAESFCLEVANRTGSGEPFLALFDMQLSCGDINKSWDLLRRYGSYMDLSAVVRRLPVDTAMADLSDYWDKTLQESVADLRIRKLVGKLSEAEQLQAKQEHISLVRKRLVITGDRICPKCTKRLGSAGLLLTTSGGIFHYTCIS